MTIDFGLVLPAGPPKGALDRWRDDLDAVLPVVASRFRSLWMTDHFFWDDAPTFEAWTVLAYAAARWPQFELGPIVLGQSYRNPALLAKMAATLQTLTRGRLIMAIGAGWKEDEYHAYGYDFPRPGVRVQQLEEALEIITRLWTEPGQVTYRGEYYHVVDAWCEPKPDPVPPLLVGGGGVKTMRLAARFADFWNIPDANIATYRERMAVLDEHCAALGRDPATIRRSWFGRMVLGRDDAEVAARGGQWTRANALAGTPAQVVAQLRGIYRHRRRLFHDRSARPPST
ncbi:MAG: LLM class flavin-dependent oxidoreductase [Caldilineaceae bacterium]